MVWYKGFMKIPKKVYLVAAVLLFMGGAGTVLALQPNTPPKEVTVKQVAASTPVQAAPVTQPTQTAVAPTPAPAVAVAPVPPAPTPEQIKADALNRVSNYASSRGWNVEVQKHCAEIHYNSFKDHIDEWFITGINVKDISKGNQHYDRAPITSDEQGVGRIRYNGYGSCTILYQVDPA